jgi:glutaredoxin domain-containing cysteine-rich protein 1
MGGLRSRILRTLQSFPNAAAQSSNLLLVLPPGASHSPQPPAAPWPCGRLQEPAPQEVLVDEAGAAPEVPGGGGDDDDDDKENVSPGVTPRKAKKMKLSSDHHGEDPADGATRYRRPDLASATLFDPDLLAAFRRAVDAYAQALDEAKRRDDDIDDGEDGDGGEGGPGVADPLEAFELRCPPGGERAVVLYTTSIRGLRKTIEDGARVRRLLEGLRVRCGQGQEEEVGGARAFPLPPRLFVDGLYHGEATPWQLVDLASSSASHAALLPSSPRPAPVSRGADAGGGAG